MKTPNPGPGQPPTGPRPPAGPSNPTPPPGPKGAERLYTVAQVAEMWSCDDNTVYRLIHSGELRYVDISAKGTKRPRLRVPESALAEYLAKSRRTSKRAA